MTDTQWQPQGEYIYNPEWFSQGARATPEEAKMLSRLATRAVEEANAFGIHIDHKEGLRRARENLAFVRAMAGADRRVHNDER